MAPQQLRIGFDDAVGWLVSGAAPGPAGVVSLMLADLRITVDAVQTDRLIEMAVFADAGDRRVPDAALAACASLFGPELADALAGPPAGPLADPLAGRPDPAAEISAEITAEITATPTSLWQQVAWAARAEFLRLHDRRSPRLASLRLVSAGQAVASLGGDELLRRRAWEALPAVIGAGRTAARYPELVDQLTPQDRHDLAGAITALTALLKADDWDGNGSGPIGDLTALLAPPPSDTELAMLAAGPAADDEPAERVPMYLRRSGPAELDLDWTAASEDLRGRLGEFADEAFAGARATGQIPGQVNVRMELRDTLPPDVPAIAVRVLAWDGELLGEAPLRVVTPAGRHPRGECVIAVGAPADADLASEYGVHIDIAVAGLPPLDAAGLRRTARGLARRSGVNALLARHAGDYRETEHWARCARMYAVAGDSMRAATAEAESRARTAAERADIPVRGPGDSAGDWADRLLATWLRLTSRLVPETAGETTPGTIPVRVDELQRIIQDLSFAADVAPEVATAHEKLASALLRSADEADRSSAIGHLHEALRLRHLTGDPQGAARLLRQITNAATSADGSGGGDAGRAE